MGLVFGTALFAATTRNIALTSSLVLIKFISLSRDKLFLFQSSLIVNNSCAADLETNSTFLKFKLTCFDKAALICAFKRSTISREDIIVASTSDISIVEFLSIFICLNLLIPYHEMRNYST